MVMAETAVKVLRIARTPCLVKFFGDSVNRLEWLTNNGAWGRRKQ